VLAPPEPPAEPPTPPALAALWPAVALPPLPPAPARDALPLQPKIAKAVMTMAARPSVENMHVIESFLDVPLVSPTILSAAVTTAAVLSGTFRLLDTVYTSRWIAACIQC
jgi:hypothetical protein